MSVKYYYYISSGAKNKMYTLRVSFTEIRTSSSGTSYPIPHDLYCCNLSTDIDKAYAKARECVDYRSEHRDCELINREDVPTLEKIYHRSQEELEEARRLAAEYAKAAEERYQYEMEQRTHRKIKTIEENIWPFGQYRERPFGQEIKMSRDSYEPDYRYIKFMGEMKLEEADDTRDLKHIMVMEHLQKKLKEQFPQLFNLPKPNGNYYGKIKSREDFNLTLISETSFPSQFGYNQWTHIQRFVKDTGELIVYMGSSPIKCELGCDVSVKGTIKKHDEYKGDNQTFISRPKLLAA